MRPLMANADKHLRDPRYGITNTNGETWKCQKKMFVKLMRATGFEKSHVKGVVDRMWPKLKHALTAHPSTVVQLKEPNQKGRNSVKDC